MPPRQLRKKEEEADSEDPPVARPPVPAPVGKKSKKAAAAAATGPSLSFDMDDEGEAFQVKKKKKRRPAPVAEDGRPDTGGGATGSAAPVDTLVSGGAGIYTAQMLAKLRGEQQYRVVKDDGKPIPGDVVPEAADASGSGLPDAEAIRLARAQRERME